jgi:hypothetical protein
MALCNKWYYFHFRDTDFKTGKNIVKTIAPNLNEDLGKKNAY